MEDHYTLIKTIHMVTNIRAICTTLSLCASLVASAQSSVSDSIHLLREVEIKSLRPQSVRSSSTAEIFPANSLQSQFGDVYIRNTGFGQLSTISLRGMGAQNVTVLWNELPINSPASGLYDLNQLPSLLTQNLQMNLDNNRLTTAGSFAMSHPNTKESVIILSSTAYLSSLYSHRLEGNLPIGKGNLSFNQQYTHGVNNFEYMDAQGQRSKMDINGQTLSNTQLSVAYPLGKNWELSSGVWYLNTDRQNPGSESYRIKANMEDYNLRVFAGVKNQNLTVKLAYYNELKTYFPNDNFTANSDYNIKSYRGFVHYHTDLTAKVKIDYKLYPSRFQIQSSNYPVEEIINEASQQINLQYRAASKLVLDGGIKSVTHSYFSNLFLLFVSATYEANDRLSVQLIGDLNQRNPNGDELFFNLSDPFFTYRGNRNLAPELNYQLRNVWRYEYKNSHDRLRLNAEPYLLRSIDNIKDTFDAFFSSGGPINISQVTNYGLQTHIEWLRTVARNQYLRTVISFNYIDSKDGDDRFLAYVPSLKTIASLEYIHPDFEVFMQNNYTSQRYTNVANTSRLDPYFLTNLKGTYKHRIGANQINFSIGIDNLWNEDYQELGGYSMPLRNYYINLTAILK